MSLSLVADPGSLRSGVPLPDAEAWKAMSLLSGDHVAELPCVRNVCSVPSASITNRSERFVVHGNAHVAQPVKRALSKTTFLPSGDKLGKPSKDVLSVKRRGFVSSGFAK
jgi:hypothetical protein